MTSLGRSTLVDWNMNNPVMAMEVGVKRSLPQAVARGRVKLNISMEST